mgnify:FL=1
MLSVFNRLAVINILIKEQADGTRKSQFDAVDLDAKQIVKEVVESSDVANKMMQKMKDIMGEASMQLFAECHQNLLDNQEEAVKFVQQFIDMCNAGFEVGVN